MAEVASQPGALGSGVFGYNDAYRRLRPYVRDWRAACAAADAGGGELLRVGTDVSQTQASTSMQLPALTSSLQGTCPSVISPQYDVMSLQCRSHTMLVLLRIPAASRVSA